MDLTDPTTTFRCRKCRILLFSSSELQSHTARSDQVSLDLSCFDTCSSWFLKDDDIIPWIAESVQKAQWTEGKLYCPKCNSRIGAFDFIHGIQCNCGKFTIPAVWIQKSRVDHILTQSQITNLQIRYPVSFEPSTERHLGSISEVQSGVNENDCNMPELENICSSQTTCPSHTNKLQDQALQSNPSANSTVKVNACSMEKSQVGKRLKKIRKGRHQTRSLEDNAFELCEEMKKELEATWATTDNENMYNCLRVDEGFDELAIRHKVVIPEIQDRHCCSVCLDLLYEPFRCSCDHVFCDPCLRQLNFRIGRNGIISCPLCRQIVEHVTPATELRNEIRNTYDSHILRKREKAERRASYRKWPLPSGQMPSRRVLSRTCNMSDASIISTLIIGLVCAFLYSLVLTVVVQVLSD